MPNSARDILRNVLPRNMADEIWSARYDKVLPISSNDFDLSAVLPAVLYMFRFGQRRGRGRFLDTFVREDGTRPQRRRKATVDRVAKSLTATTDLHGFDGATERAVLGDLLLCFGLENRKRDLGRDKQIQRVAPAHYLASWVDLPDSVANLRYVPEMIVAMLADQKGAHVEPNSEEDRTWFAVARGFEHNVLLRAFSPGIDHRGGFLADRNSDRFDETDESVGLDQLLMIRLAQQLGEAPDRPRGRETARISNQRPIAERAAEYFSEDIRQFVRAYATETPRHTFIDMLEACISIGMTAILTSVVEMLFAWSDTGAVPPRRDQQPAGIFVDCSNGVDTRLRGLAERSMDDLMRRVERVPVVLTTLRLLDYLARSNKRVVTQDIPTRPYATEWLKVLGDLLHERHAEAPFIHRQMDDHSETLAEQLEADYPAAAEVLRDDKSEPNPILRLATAVTPLMGRRHLIEMVDSMLQIGRPNALALKRVTTRGAGTAGSGRRRRDVRALVLGDSALDHLVHLHLLRSGNAGLGLRVLSLTDFLRKIRERYGFHVDTAPSGTAISNELLQQNRRFLERRLRDLGLLIGVNDAEAMKRLQTRFAPKET